MYYPLSVYSTTKYTKEQLNLNKGKLKKFQRMLKRSEPRELSPLYQTLGYIYRELHSIMEVRSSKDNIKIISLLKKMIPLEYFGSLKNRKKFLFIVNRILTHTEGEHIHTSCLYENYDYDVLWLNIFPQNEKKEQLKKANILLLETVVKPLIKHFYVSMKDYKGRKILQIPRDKYYRFNDKILAKHIRSGFITRAGETVEKTATRGILKWVPKKKVENLLYRPIVITSNKDKSLQKNLKTKLISLANQFKVTSKENIFDVWLSFVKSTKGRKIFGIKLDIVDAFGNVDLNVLSNLIQNGSMLTDQEKKYLYKHIKEQYVYRSGKHVYQWHHGLMQGDRLSSALCDLYLSYLENVHLSMFNIPRCLMHRTVDDILFVSNHQTDIFEFELCANKIYVLNETKTLKYLGTPECNPCIPYYGKVFNLDTKELSNYYLFDKETEIRTKFKFWNPKYPHSPENAFKFITYSMKFEYVNFCFTKFELNSTTNSVETILRNIYEGMCYVAFKMDCAIQAIKYAFTTREKFNETVLNVLDFILQNYIKIILGFIKRYKGDKHRNVFSFKFLNTISLRAFLVVLRKRSLSYQDVIKEIKNRLKKSSIPLQEREINLSVKYFLQLPSVFSHIKMKRTFQN